MVPLPPAFRDALHAVVDVLGLVVYQTLVGAALTLVAWLMV